MKEKVLGFIMNMLGVGKLLAAVDGKKGYIGGAGQILTGASLTLGAAAKLLLAIIPLKGTAEYLAFAQGLANNSDVLVLASGVALVSKGLADIGQRHAIAKAEAKAQ